MHVQQKKIAVLNEEFNLNNRTVYSGIYYRKKNVLNNQQQWKQYVNDYIYKTVQSPLLTLISTKQLLIRQAPRQRYEELLPIPLQKLFGPACFTITAFQKDWGQDSDWTTLKYIISSI